MQRWANEATATITAYLAAREAEGFVEVPKELTEYMLDNGACYEDPDRLY